MLAIYFSIRSYINQLKDQHLKVFSGNTVAVTVIHKMGSSKRKSCNELAKLIWEYYTKFNV